LEIKAYSKEALARVGKVKDKPELDKQPFLDWIAECVLLFS